MLTTRLVLILAILAALLAAEAQQAATVPRIGRLSVASRTPEGLRLLEVRGPLIIRGDVAPEMKLDLFMKDLHLIQEAAAGVGAPLPLTDVAERLYAAAQGAGRGGEGLSVGATALGTSTWTTGAT
jgi:3-hydroxyisobutyrate dehydrogenase